MVKSSSNWFVYIIKASNNHLYTGITTNLERRLKEHQEKKNGAKYFNSTFAESIVFVCEVENRSAASKIEARIKKLKRTEKLKIISSDDNQLHQKLSRPECK